MELGIGIGDRDSGLGLGIEKLDIVLGLVIGDSELQKVITFRIANLPDDIRKASQTFRIAIGLLNFYKTFRVALLPRFPCFCDSVVKPKK